MKKVINIISFEWLIYILSILLIFVLACIYKSGIFELISTLLGLVAVSLNSKKKTQCFFFYVFYVLIYGIVSIINKQYGEGILNLCYNLPLYLITLYHLYIKRSEKKVDNIVNLSRNQWLYIVFFIPLVTLVYGYVLLLIKSNNPFFNALATAFSLVAAFLASKFVKQQWLFWICYSLVLTYIWLVNFLESQTGVLYLVLNIIYIILNINGYITWNKLEKEM